MALTKAVVRLPYFTGIPEDVATNSFYFETVAAPTLDQRNAMFLAVQGFYIANAGSGSVDEYLSFVLSRAELACSVDLYDMDQPEPRVPIDSNTFTLGAAAGTAALPTEVSLCLSYRAQYVSGSPNARRRGRIYVGPLNTNAGTGGSGAAFPVPNDTFRNIVLDSASQFLATDPIAEGVNWCVFSTVDEVARQIVEVWTDNAWDTQRRRGNSPTNRIQVAVPLP